MKINIDEIFREISKLQNREKADWMENYMRNQFQFLGVDTPTRKDFLKKYLQKIPKNSEIDWDFIEACFRHQYREMMYIWCNYLSHLEKNLQKSDITKLVKLAKINSWWDSIDNLHKFFGKITLKTPETKNEILTLSTDENFWIRRIAIDHQLGFKEQTDTDLLEKIICNNFGSNEFFINKAIGWALRDFSKTNPDWVKNFVNRNREKMANLSIREASKYI